MEKITIEKAKNDLIGIFGAVSHEEFRKRKEHLSWYSDNDDSVTFFIDKNVTERGEVLQKLKAYFEERVIKGGYCNVSTITLVWTTFELKKGKPNTL